MAIDIATLAACHVAPPFGDEFGDEDGGLAYSHLCGDGENCELWLYLVQQMDEQFPHLRSIRDEKFIGQIFDLCSQNFHRAPHELKGPEWDAAMLLKLKVRSEPVNEPSMA